MTIRSGTPSHLGRSLLAICTGIACTVALAVMPASAADDQGRLVPKLKGSVGPGYVISISDDSVPAGKYKLIVTDKGTIHNFHISGAGVDEKTKVTGTGKVVWTIRLRPGEYTIVCDPHVEVMNLTLTVT